jgi:hypothetical protein
MSEERERALEAALESVADPDGEAPSLLQLVGAGYDAREPEIERLRTILKRLRALASSDRVNIPASNEIIVAFGDAEKEFR